MDQTFTVVVDAERITAARPAFDEAVTRHSLTSLRWFIRPWFWKLFGVLGWLLFLVATVLMLNEPPPEPRWRLGMNAALGLFLAVGVGRRGAKVYEAGFVRLQRWGWDG